MAAVTRFGKTLLRKVENATNDKLSQGLIVPQEILRGAGQFANWIVSALTKPQDSKYDLAVEAAQEQKQRRYKSVHWLECEDNHYQAVLVVERTTVHTKSLEGIVAAAAFPQAGVVAGWADQAACWYRYKGVVVQVAGEAIPLESRECNEFFYRLAVLIENGYLVEGDYVDDLRCGAYLVRKNGMWFATSARADWSVLDA